MQIAVIVISAAILALNILSAVQSYRIWRYQKQLEARIAALEKQVEMQS